MIFVLRQAQHEREIALSRKSEARSGLNRGHKNASYQEQLSICRWAYADGMRDRSRDVHSTMWI